MYPTRTERRTDSRLPLKRAVKFAVAGQLVEGQVQDISRSGLRLRASDLPPVACTTTIELCLREDASSASHARVRGQVMWTSLNTAGIRFVEPHGDFVEQLDRLLRGYLLVAEPQDVRGFVDRLFDEASFASKRDKDGSTVLFDLGRLSDDDAAEADTSEHPPPNEHESDSGTGHR